VYYLHNNWEIVDKRNIVKNKNTQYNLHYVTPFITARQRTASDLCIYNYSYDLGYIDDKELL